MTIVAGMESVEFVPHGPSLDRAGILSLHRDRVRLRSVWAGGIHVGTITETLLDADCRRVAGFEVRVGDGDDRFCPLVAVRSLGPTGIEIDSPLHLVRDLRFYQAAGRPLRDLLAMVARCRHERGTPITDVIADLATGDVIGFELADGRRPARDEATVAGNELRLACGCTEPATRR
jgi:hypothetical protein